jgi:hypothetical protein
MAVVEERPDLTLCFASDGAKYHWKVLTAMACQLPEEATGDVYFLVDVFYVAEHLADAAKAIAGEDTPEVCMPPRQRWRRSQRRSYAIVVPPAVRRTTASRTRTPTASRAAATCLGLQRLGKASASPCRRSQCPAHGTPFDTSLLGSLDTLSEQR